MASDKLVPVACQMLSFDNLPHFCDVVVDASFPVILILMYYFEISAYNKTFCSFQFAHSPFLLFVKLISSLSPLFTLILGPRFIFFGLSPLFIFCNLVFFCSRMEDISQENSDLRNKCEKYERSNQSLMTQLTKLQNMIKKIAPQQSASQTGICLMVSTRQS